MLKISPAETTKVTKLTCPICNSSVSNVGLMKDSEVRGLSFTCKKCKKPWLVETTK